MPYVKFNPNPQNKRVGDCAVRAVCKALGMSWEDAYINLAAEGMYYHDMPSSNYVWGMYLRRFGFKQKSIPFICPECTTVADFAELHPKGRYVLGCEGHVVCCIDGSYFDSWDSGSELVIFYLEKEE